MAPPADAAPSVNPTRPHSNSDHTFDGLGLAEPIRRALRDSGYEVPTPIQHQSIPVLLEGRDLLGCAQTGTGKTAAFALPVIQRLLAAPRRSKAPRALILAPTRELAVQIADSFITYGRHAKISVTTVFGGVSQFRQVKALRRGVDVLVATPGRLLDLMQQKEVDLTSVEVLVLDEADRMLDMGFIDPVRKIAASVPTKRQTLLFSATMPREVASLAESLLRDPVRVAVAPVASAAPKIRQAVYLVDQGAKVDLLETLLHALTPERALVFVRTKHGADKLCRRLEKSGFRTGAIHGNKAQNARQRALEAFRSGRMPVLVATDVAARGIDIDDVSHVFNFDLPFEPEAYVHRIGRTGRAGAEGEAIAFCGRDERGLLRQIEKLIGTPIDRAEGSDASLEFTSDHGGGSDGSPRRGHGRGRGGHAKRGAGHSGPSRHAGPSRGGSHRDARSGPKARSHDERPSRASKPDRHEHPARGARGSATGGAPHASRSPGTEAPAGRQITRGWHRPTKRR
ncbi:MAG: DEAD/DEAH box helicase [Phycisphaeraceae bacterium]|nr:DEAD/DEAH box helicase [Phycisphaeraceae bacterium]